MRRLLLLGCALAFAAPTIAQDLPLAFHPITPCRWLDTRFDECVVGEQGCHVGPMVDDETRRYFVQAAAICPRTGADRPIPLGAKALLVTVTVTDVLGSGYLTLYDSTLWDRPVASSISFVSGKTATSLVFVSLGQEQGQGPGIPFRPDLAIFARVAGGGTVHVIVDIVGYLKE